MAIARLIWPNWPACETFRPRLPDWGMSNILALAEIPGDFSLARLSEG
jgi:hypothetical protein